MASFFLHEGPGGAHCVYADLPGNYGLCGLFRCGEGLGITAFCLTLRHTDEDGTVRTGLQGLAVYLIPDFTGLTVSRFLKILLDAMSQIEIFDTCVALLAGAMIIPAIYVFSGTEGMTSGPGLMFVSLPKIFRAMGGIGTVLGVVFFVMVAPAALTSSVSIMETLVASCMEMFRTTRKKMSMLIGVLSAVAAMLICILVGWVIKLRWIAEEMESGGHIFRRKRLYSFMIRYAAPVIRTILFLQSTGIL